MNAIDRGHGPDNYSEQDILELLYLHDKEYKEWVRQAKKRGATSRELEGLHDRLLDIAVPLETARMGARQERT